MYIDNLAYLDSVRPARVLGFGRGNCRIRLFISPGRGGVRVKIQYFQYCIFTLTPFLLTPYFLEIAECPFSFR
jgi:hypothetical protein